MTAEHRIVLIAMLAGAVTALGSFGAGLVIRRWLR